MARAKIFVPMLGIGKHLEMNCGIRYLRGAHSEIRVEAHEDVQVVIHDGEPADGCGEGSRKFFEPFFDPISRVDVFLGHAEQEPAPVATADAVIPARDGDVDQIRKEEDAEVAARKIRIRVVRPKPNR